MKHTCNCTSGCKHLTLGSLIDWCGGKSELSEPQRKKRIATVWNDSRKVTSGDVFVAIRTDRDDGHSYIDAAFKAGATAAIVDKKRSDICSSANRKKLILVSDPLKAVQRAAARYRKEMGILIVGVTGSSGKTTTRSFIASVLKQAVSVGETFGNWNNHIGVPLSLLRFTGEEWAGVIEMGANHVHEIHDLSKIAQPDIGIITNIGYAHVGLFGSLAHTTKAKFEIVDGLSRQGFLLLNGDDHRLVKEIREREGIRAVLYGHSARCQIRPQQVKVDATTGVSFTLDGSRFELPMPGRHFIYSALPAIYIGRRCRIPDEHIAQALAAQKPVTMRGGVEKKQGVSFIVDCYNANPSSMKSALVYLGDIAKPSSRVAIVGDMLELGKYSRRLHQNLGKDLARAGIKKVIAVGEYSSDIATAAKQGGIASRNIFTAADSHQAISIAEKVLCDGDVVLLKGSRGIHLETIFEQFRA